MAESCRQERSNAVQDQARQASGRRGLAQACNCVSDPGSFRKILQEDKCYDRRYRMPTLLL